MVQHPEIISIEFIESAIAVNDLREGMRLKKDILTQQHILVLPKGHVFSAASISQLIQYEKQKSERFEIFVEQPENEKLSAGA